MSTDLEQRGINVKFPPASFNLPAAVGDGVTDDTQRIQDIYNKLKTGETLIIPPSFDASGAEKAYMISNLIFDKSEVHIDCQGWLMQKSNVTNEQKVAITLQGQATHTQHIEARIKVKKAGSWANSWGQGSIGVKMRNLSNSKITVYARDFGTNLLLEGDGEGCGYNSIYPQFLINGKKNIAFKVTCTSKDNKGWVNENKFFGGSFAWNSCITDMDRYHIYMPEAEPNPFEPNGKVYSPDNNVFFSPSLESDEKGVAIFCEGRRNHFYSPRLEMHDSPTIVHFGPKSFKNHLVYPWHAYDVLDTEKFKDEGKENHIVGNNTIFYNDTQIRPYNIKIRGAKNKVSTNSENDNLQLNWGSSGLIDVAPKVFSNNNDFTFDNNEKLWVGKKISENENNTTSEVITSSIDALGNANFASVTTAKLINRLIYGNRNCCYKLCEYSSDYINSNDAEMLHFRIINSRHYESPSVSDIMIDYKGNIFAENKYVTEMSPQVYIATYKFNERDKEGTNPVVKIFDVGVYLFSDHGSDKWELQCLNNSAVNLDIVAIKTDLAVLPNDITELLLEDNTIPVANSKTGLGCIGDMRINTKKVWHEGNMPAIRISNGQLQFHDGTTWKTLQTV